MLEKRKYPSITDYKIAIQDPDSFATLKNVEVQWKEDDLHFASGNFAVVFKVRIGTDFFALKCFLKEQNNRIDRLKSISKYIRNNPSDYWTNFEFLENELWITDNENNQLEVSVILMKWIDSPTLGQIISKLTNENSIKKLNVLNENIIKLFRWLIENRVAHGDLKHDNILINEDSLDPVLIDYDGLFLLEFEGETSNELGGKCYQHPKRNEFDFDENLDCFSMLVILTSIKMLIEDIELFNKYHNGQNLIFDSSFFTSNSKDKFWNILNNNKTLDKYANIWRQIDYDFFENYSEQLCELLEIPPVEPIFYLENQKGKEFRELWYNKLPDNLKLLFEKNKYNLDQLKKTEKLSLVNKFFFQHEIKTINQLKRLTKIKEIYLIGFDEIEDFNSIYCLNNIEELYIETKNNIKSLTFTNNLKNLNTLHLLSNSNLDILDDIKPSNKIQELMLSKFSCISETFNLDNFKEVRSLAMSSISKLNDLNFIYNLEKIRHLELSVLCFKNKLSLDLNGINKLEFLRLDFLEGLTCIRSIDSHSELKTLIITNNSDLEYIEDFSCLDKLEYLELTEIPLLDINHKGLKMKIGSLKSINVINDDEEITFF